MSEEQQELPFPYNMYGKKKDKGKLTKEQVKSLMSVVLTGILWSFIIAWLSWWIYNDFWAPVFKLPEIGYWMIYFTYFTIRMAMTK